MTSARSRRRRHAMLQKAATDVDISRRFNELRRELLNDRAKTIGWWLSGMAIFLTLFSIVAAVAGYLTFERFDKIEVEARKNMESSRSYAKTAQTLVDQIKAKRDEATFFLEQLTAEVVERDPQGAKEAAESVQENPAASPIDQAVAAAVLLQREGDIERAIEKWRAVANVVDGIDKEKKTGSRAWFSIGYLLGENERNDLEEVIHAYDEALRLDPDLAKAYNNRGNAKGRLRRYKEAIADYDEAIRLDSDYAYAYNNRGNAKSLLGLYKEAIADHDKAIRLDPDFAKAYSNRGNAKSNRGLYKEAIADYDKAIRLDSDYAYAYNNRGNAKNNLGQHEEARRDYETAISLARSTGDYTLASHAERALKKLSGEQGP